MDPPRLHGSDETARRNVRLHISAGLRRRTGHGTCERRDHLLQRDRHRARPGASRGGGRGEGRRERPAAQGRRAGAAGGHRRNPAWRQHLGHRRRRRGRLDDLAWADAVLFGTPARFGNPAAALRAFIETTGRLWHEGKLAGKVYSAFTASRTAHGGQESTLLALGNTFYHWGGIIVPPGYTDPVQFQTGNPYGTSHVSGGGPPDDVALEAGSPGPARRRHRGGPQGRGRAVESRTMSWWPVGAAAGAPAAASAPSPGPSAPCRSSAGGRWSGWARDPRPPTRRRNPRPRPSPVRRSAAPQRRQHPHGHRVVERDDRGGRRVLAHDLLGRDPPAARG